MSTLVEYETIAFVLALSCVVLFLSGIVFFKPSNFFVEMPTNNRPAFVLVAIGIMFAFFTVLAVAIYCLQQLLAPT